MDVRRAVRVLDAAETARVTSGAVDEQIRGALGLVCRFAGWPLGHVYLVDPATGVLRPEDLWHALEPERFRRFIEATMRAPLSPGDGLPGRVLVSEQPVWMADLDQDPRAAAAAACGIAAACGFPIVGASGVQGVLEFFPSGPTRPAELLLELLSHVAIEIGNVLDSAHLREALRASQVRLTEAERLGRLGTWLYHVEEDVLDWSEELRVLYGMEPCATPGTFDEFLERVHPDDVDHVRRSILRTIETEQPFDHEYRLVIRPDDVRWAHSRGAVVGAGDRRGSTLLAGYCQNVTEKKASDEALRLQRERLLMAERMARLGWWDWDVRTNQVACSEELCRMHGFESADPPIPYDFLMGRVHPDDRDRVLAASDHMMRTQEPMSLECRIVLPDGSQRWLNVCGQAVEDVEGTATRFAGYTQDVTDRRRAEEERARMETRMHQSQRLESLGQLAGGVAHDFNNLLTAILSYSVFIADGLSSMASGQPGSGPDELLADVQQVRRAAQRAAELTRRLLAFGRREVIRPEVVRLNDVVSEVEELLARTLGNHIELTASLAPDLAPVRADPGQIEQVLLNLAINARDAMPGGGTLRIETSDVDLGPEDVGEFAELRPGRHVRLRVSDTGHGMSKEIAERAFEPFFTTKPKGEGSGLGLASVHGIVAQSGGGVQLESTLGAGTVITILWPATEAAAAPLPEPRPRTIDPAGCRTILVVDDEVALREVMRRLLAQCGYTVLVARSGAEAIQLASSHPGEIDVLLTDVIMPGMGGQEVAAAVMGVRPGIRVIYMSGYASAALTANGPLAADTLLVEKPFTEDELVSAVQRAVETAAALAPGAR